MEVVADLVVFDVHGGGRDRHGEMHRLTHAHADTPILVKTVQHVPLSTWHDLLEGGSISLCEDDSNGLFQLSVHDEDLAGIQEEQLVSTGTRKRDLDTVVEGCGLLTTIV